ncbi:MAG: gluconolactonase [Gammaproteobacteria bacterium]|nr:MAG: gluconolactonase [Gammaproteobacteria bacterium]RLA50977.1 MAG: gluconolactonase [Gammaproteobacteria bacterium]
MKELTTTVFADNFAFLEGPRWRGDKLWVSSMHANSVFSLTMDGQREKVVELTDHPSGLGWLPDGALIIVSMHDQKLLKLVDGKLQVHADISPLVNSPINDMVIDNKGNAYVGNVGFNFFEGEKFKPTNFVLVKPDGEASEVATGLAVPNGPVVSPDGKTLVVAESWGKKLTAFDIAEDGSLANQRVWADLEGIASPDGICMDADGAIWVANFTGHNFIRVKEGGEITHSVNIDEDRAPVACTLGGSDGRTLFALTYKGLITDAGPEVLMARIETVTVEIPASGSP